MARKLGVGGCGFVLTNFLLPNAALPRVRIERAGPAGCLLRVHGRMGAQCAVEASSDLIHWQAIATHQAVAGGFTISDSVAGSNTARFYRAREN